MLWSKQRLFHELDIKVIKFYAWRKRRSKFKSLVGTYGHFGFGEKVKEIRVVLREVGKLEESKGLGLGHSSWMARHRGELHPLCHSTLSSTSGSQNAS